MHISDIAFGVKKYMILIHCQHITMWEILLVIQYIQTQKTIWVVHGKINNYNQNLVHFSWTKEDNIRWISNIMGP